MKRWLMGRGYLSSFVLARIVGAVADALFWIAKKLHQKEKIVYINKEGEEVEMKGYTKRK